MSLVKSPSVGRVVIYRAYGTPGGEYPAGVGRAAVVTQVHTPICINLVVLNPTGLFFNTSVFYHPTLPGCWSWPEYNDETFEFQGE